jgi:hypothetical protein
MPKKCIIKKTILINAGKLKKPQAIIESLETIGAMPQTFSGANGDNDEKFQK